MSVDTEQQVVKLGTSTDMGFCRSRKKVTPCLLLPTILALYAKEKLHCQLCLAQLTGFSPQNALTMQDLPSMYLVAQELEGILTSDNGHCHCCCALWSLRLPSLLQLMIVCSCTACP